MRRKSRKVVIYVYTQLIHFAIYLKLRTLLFKYTPLLNKNFKRQKRKMIQSLQLNIFIILCFSTEHQDQEACVDLWYSVDMKHDVKWFRGNLPLLRSLSRLCVQLHCSLLMLFQTPSQLKKYFLRINSLIHFRSITESFLYIYCPYTRNKFVHFVSSHA